MYLVAKNSNSYIHVHTGLLYMYMFVYIRTCPWMVTWKYNQIHNRTQKGKYNYIIQHSIAQLSQVHVSLNESVFVYIPTNIYGIHVNG